MKFNIGDKVVVARRGRNWNSDGEMDHWLGQVMTVKDAYCDTYTMEEDQSEREGGWMWDEDDLEPANAINIAMYNNKIVATDVVTGDKAEVECDDFRNGAKNAIDKLFEEKNKIKVGDTVMVIDSGRLYSTFYEWVADNVEDKKAIARYAYGKSDIDTSEKYKVIAIAPHLFIKDRTLAYIETEGSSRGYCFVINIDGIKKV